jgi:hypothetical protein
MSLEKKEIPEGFGKMPKDYDFSTRSN